MGKKRKNPCLSILEHMETDSTDVRKKDIPREIRLNRRTGDKGIYFGYWPHSNPWRYVGMPQGAEGNIMVIGGNGSGKSAGVVKPTMETWDGAICATDIKGELSEEYDHLFRAGLARRPYIIFDPMQVDGPSYDPFWWPSKDDKSNLVSNIYEIAQAIAPVLPDDPQPFWAKTGQSLLAAALMYYYQLGLSFSEATCKIIDQPLSSLCTELSESDDIYVKSLVGEAAKMKEETLATVATELRNELIHFAIDPHISHAFRGEREGAACFNWDDLSTYNIFLRIPAHRIEQWGSAIILMYSQLIRYLERRPEKYSVEGANNTQTLLLLDEFARFGKLEMIASAMSTLRSKNVNICLIVQSMSQLDKIYGEKERRIIFDNCQYQAILRANDAETQKYLADLIGTRVCIRQSVSEQLDTFKNVIGYSRQMSEVRDYIVYPHELATLNDVLLLTPYGFCRVKKFLPCDGMRSFRSISLPAIEEENHLTAFTNGSIVCYQNTPIINKDAKIMDIDKRSMNADKRVQAAKRQQRLEQKRARDNQEKEDHHRNHVVGELVIKYFPQLKNSKPGTQAENSIAFAPLEAFLATLADDVNLVVDLRGKARNRISPEGYFIPIEPECVSGPVEENNTDGGPDNS